MSHRSIGRILAGGFSAALLLAAIAASTFAQSAPVSSGGVTAGSLDLSGNAGYSNLTGADGNNHVNFGGTAGFNLSPYAALLGEYTYMPMGSRSGVAFNTQLIGAATRLNIGSSKHVVPYALAAFGFDRLNGSESGVSVSANGSYAAFGGGASLYLGRSWGIRPEFRWERQQLTFSTLVSDTNVVLGTGSIFYQWGGRASKRRP